MKAKKEKCPRCGGSEFVVADGEHSQRYCSTKGCKHIWKPLSNLEIELNYLRRENGELSRQLTAANKELIKLKGALDENSGS